MSERMEQWVRLCDVQQAPAVDEVKEVECAGEAICLANIGGDLRAINNLCPHREGPLGQGWVEGQAVVCPWHSWAFDTCTGIAQPPDRGQVRVYPLRTLGGEVQVNLA